MVWKIGTAHVPTYGGAAPGHFLTEYRVTLDWQGN